MIKTIIICSYIAHKVYWRHTHKQRVIPWNKFFNIKEGEVVGASQN
jgi:hypothetical protein